MLLTVLLKSAVVRVYWYVLYCLDVPFAERMHGLDTWYQITEVAEGGLLFLLFHPTQHTGTDQMQTGSFDFFFFYVVGVVVGVLVVVALRWVDAAGRSKPQQQNRSRSPTPHGILWFSARRARYEDVISRQAESSISPYI